MKNPVRLTRVFTYRPNAFTPYALLCFGVFFVFFGFVATMLAWEGVDGRVLSIVTLPVALTGAWTLYLWLVAKTAILVVTELGIIYRDRWIRRSLLWDEVSEVTRFAIRSRKGKGIALRLGIFALEDWQDFLKLVREMSDAKIYL